MADFSAPHLCCPCGLVFYLTRGDKMSYVNNLIMHISFWIYIITALFLILQIILIVSKDKNLLINRDFEGITASRWHAYGLQKIAATTLPGSYCGLTCHKPLMWNETGRALLYGCTSDSQTFWTFVRTKIQSIHSAYMQLIQGLDNRSILGENNDCRSYTDFHTTSKERISINRVVMPPHCSPDIYIDGNNKINLLDFVVSLSKQLNCNNLIDEDFALGF